MMEVKSVNLADDSRSTPPQKPMVAVISEQKEEIKGFIQRLGCKILHITLL